jgi:serine/threonine protein kinase
MGEVYRAVDPRLNRQIALKVLPRDLARDPERIERFQREARTVAGLNHPHIVTIYSVEHADGVHFLTMELVEGQTLDRLVPAAGLPVDRLIAIALPLADALAAAHEKGVVHRDLKPANVMVTDDGRVKVLDFGLAKTEESPAPGSDGETIARTSEGVVMGTVPYMSPEQVEGRAVDHRTDVFSLGVMIHELATGRRPFAGDSQAALLSSILRDRPESIASRRADVPPALSRLVERCLEKDRNRRIQTARDVRNELEAVHTTSGSGGVSRRAATGPERRSIIVLPFANLSPDVENEYFADGLTEEIITDLSKVKALSVISRTSAMQFKGAKKDVRTIGRELGVQYVLDGSVRKAGSNLRIAAQLIDASADAPVWSDKYSGTMDDVFEVQERVSREIVKALNITLSSDEQRSLGERLIADPRAFELYLRARQELRRYAIDSAVALVREAIRIEGETPPLLAMLAWAKVSLVRAGMSRDRSPLEEAEREARRLLESAPDAVYGRSLLGHIEYERGRLPEAVHHLKAALRREPNDSDTLFLLTVSYIGAGQNTDAQATAARLVACDPLSPLSWMALGIPEWFIGRAERSVPSLLKALELDPHTYIAQWTTGYAYALIGQIDDAERHARVLDGIGPDLPYTRQLRALIDGLRQRPHDALATLEGIDPSPLDAHQQFHLGEAFIAAGALDRGLELLEQAVSGFHPYPFMAEYCRFLDPVRHTPRFAQLLATAKAACDGFAQREAALG